MSSQVRSPSQLTAKRFARFGKKPVYFLVTILMIIATTYLYAIQTKGLPKHVTPPAVTQVTQSDQWFDAMPDGIVQPKPPEPAPLPIEPVIELSAPDPEEDARAKRRREAHEKALIAPLRVAGFRQKRGARSIAAKSMSGEQANARMLRPPPSAFVVMAGTAISATLGTGVNSEVPGLVTAFVSQNVYDTPTATHLLIPQGSRLVGRYDSKVNFGQRRLQIVWQRLMLPNGSSLTIDSPSADPSGMAGISGRVNNHLWPTFGRTLLLAAISTGTQLSQTTGFNRGGYGAPNASGVASAALGQEVNRTGQELTRRNLDVPPTIEVAAGERIVVMLSEDLIFPGPYTESANFFAGGRP